MPITVHHRPADPDRAYKIHAWDGTTTWDVLGNRTGAGFDFVLPDLPDARKLRFMFRSTDPTTHLEVWEGDDFIRRVRLASPDEIWSFEAAARILYRDPAPAGVTFAAGQVVAVNVVTERRFKGGRLYAWNPFDRSAAPLVFPEASRADPVSTFDVPLIPWMTGGFHFKLLRPGGGPDGTDDWEPDSANRLWRPSDGPSVWVKSGQVSVRGGPLALTPLPVELLYPASLGSPPPLELIDPVEDLHLPFGGTAAAFPGSPLFRLASYAVAVYPDAAYALAVAGGVEGDLRPRPFPADPDDLAAPSRTVLGAAGWLAAFPAVAPSVTLVVEPKPASSFAGGLTVRVAVGTAPPHEVAPAAPAADGTWRATLTGVATLPNRVRLVPAAGDEPTPYAVLDTTRTLTPPDMPTTYFTAEGVYGLTTRGKVPFAEPPAGRLALMQAAFGAAAVRAGVFGPDELPHGPTVLGPETYFVLHAPHAAWAELVLVDEGAAGGPARKRVPMSLTGDTRYWWCTVPAPAAPPGTRYRFALNDQTEVNDPAARAVLDSGDFRTSPSDDPADPGKTWSVVLDVPAVRAAAHAAPWQTMGWEALVLYEVHPKRFTDLSPGALAPLEVLADELRPQSRLGRPGYLRGLPATALQLMPVSEFKSTNSWGYNPSFFFAVDSGYGGALALAKFVSAAHAAGRGVLLDVVYNHMLDSPLTDVARDVYRNGDAWGDRITNAHPAVKEFFRQATVYQWRTFGVDGFRFDSTKTIVENDGWDFLAAVRAAVRAAAGAEGQAWPYFVGENDPKYWDVTNPAWGVMDGQWAIDEVYRLGDVAYDPWRAEDDRAPGLKAAMDAPQTWGRPFYEATRFGESHDSVSGQADGQSNRRIAARPPFGLGLRMAKAVGAVALLSNGVPMLFMGEEVGETRFFSFDNDGPVTNPQLHDVPGGQSPNARVLAWFRSLMGLRNDPAKGLRGNDSAQAVRTGRRTVAFTCGSHARLFVVATFGTPDQEQDSSWLGLPAGGAYKEIFNSSWPVFQVEAEEERTNGGYDADIWSGRLLRLPYVGAVVLERR